MVVAWHTDDVGPPAFDLGGPADVFSYGTSERDIP